MILVYSPCSFISFDTRRDHSEPIFFTQCNSCQQSLRSCHIQLIIRIARILFQQLLIYRNDFSTRLLQNCVSNFITILGLSTEPERYSPNKVNCWMFGKVIPCLTQNFNRFIVIFIIESAYTLPHNFISGFICSSYYRRIESKH